MSRKPFVIIVIVLLAIGGGTVFLLASSADKTTKQEMVNGEPGSSSQTVTNTDQEEASDQPGSYVDYSPSIIANTSGIKLLFFHAPWCPQCRAMEADIERKGVPSGVTIIKIDYDTNQSLRQKYGVTLQTTVVKVDDQGNLVSKFVAYDNPSLQAIKEQLL